MQLSVLLFILAAINITCSRHNPFRGYYNHTFGNRIDGDVLSYNLKDYVPLFHPIYEVKLKPQRDDVESNFTFVTVEVTNKFATIFVKYDPTQLLVTFSWKFPFTLTSFEITGYSLRKGLRHSSLTALRNLIHDLKY